MVQCNYCGYRMTADEYGLIDGPVHLKNEHDMILQSSDSVENYFHFVKVEI